MGWLKWLFGGTVKTALTRERKEPALSRSHPVPVIRPTVMYSLDSLIEVWVGRIWDGDTVTVFHHNVEYIVRLDTIDCPEGDQPWGDRAQKGLAKLIAKRTVYLETHGYDIYGRLLATLYVVIEGELVNVNERMVMQGHAWFMWMYANQLSKRRGRQLQILERWAKGKRVGLWGQADPIPPWVWRRRDLKSG